MGKPRLKHDPCSGVTPEQSRDARARAWTYVFEVYLKKKGGSATAPDDVNGSKNDHARTSIP